jgi:bacterioferritin-associated ferredoxin
LIVCHCNFISHHDIARVGAELARSRPADDPVTIEAVYEALGKQPRCRTCLELAASFLGLPQTDGAAVSTAPDDIPHLLETTEDALTSTPRMG